LYLPFRAQMGHTALNGLHCLLSNAYRWAFPGMIRPEHDINNVPSFFSGLRMHRAALLLTRTWRDTCCTEPNLCRRQSTFHIKQYVGGGGVNVNPLKPSGHYMYRQFNIKQFYVQPTQLFLCVLCGSQNKQPLFPYTTLTDWFV